MHVRIKRYSFTDFAMTLLLHIKASRHCMYCTLYWILNDLKVGSGSKSGTDPSGSTTIPWLYTWRWPRRWWGCSCTWCTWWQSCPRNTWRSRCPCRSGWWTTCSPPACQRWVRGAIFTVFKNFKVRKKFSLRCFLKIIFAQGCLKLNYICYF